MVSALVSKLKSIDDVSSCTIKQLRIKLIEMGINMSNIEKTLIMSAAAALSESEESEESEEEEEENEEDGFDKLSEEYKNRFGDVVWAYSFKMWYV